MGDDVKVTVRPCNCSQLKPTTNTTGQTQQPVSIHTQQQPQGCAAGAALGAGAGNLLGGLLGGIFGTAVFGLNSLASLSTAANSGGMGLGDMLLMSKLSKNNGCCHSNNSWQSPIVINNYRGYSLCRGFRHPMPTRFTCRPRFQTFGFGGCRTAFTTFNLTPSGRYMPQRFNFGLNRFC